MGKCVSAFDCSAEEEEFDTWKQAIIRKLAGDFRLDMKVRLLIRLLA